MVYIRKKKNLENNPANVNVFVSGGEAEQPDCGSQNDGEEGQKLVPVELGNKLW